MKRHIQRYLKNEENNMYSVEECLQILEKMKLMCNEDDDIEVFDKALYKVGMEGDMSVIERLCTVLDDETEGPSSAMDDILETIFYISEKYGHIEEGIYIFLSNGYKIVKNAAFWFEIFNKKLLNTERLQEHYISAIKRLDKKNLEILLNTLDDIEKEDDEDYYKESIDLIRENIKSIE